MNSTKNIDSDSKKRYKKIINTTCLIFLYIIAVTSVFAIVFYLGFKTNLNIPGITKAAELVETKAVNPKSIVTKKRDDAVDQVIEILRPATDSDGMSYEEYIEAMEKINSETEVKASLLNFNLLLKAEDSGNDSNHFEIEIDGEAESDNENDNTMLKMYISAESDSKEEGSIEMIMNYNESDPSAFFRIMDFSFLDEIEDSLEMKVDGRWFSYNQKELEDYLEQMDQDYGNNVSYEEEDMRIKISEEDLESIERILKSDNLLGEVRWEEAKTFEGKRARCMSHTWQSEDIEAILDDVLDSSLIDDDMTENMLEDIEYIKLEYCVDRSDSAKLYEVRITGKVKSEYERNLYYSEVEKGNITVEFEFSMNISGYGESRTVDLPEDSDSIIEFVEEILSANVTATTQSTMGISSSDEEYRMYTLYVNDNCPYCDMVIDYLDESEFEKHYTIAVRNISEDKSAESYFKAICATNLSSSNCSVPLLEVYTINFDDNQSVDGNYPEYIIGYENIIEHLEEQLDSVK